ncbi:hypothetical protein ACKKBG_A00140 [Auxenochlorella protothecoides x Auxenochlorella symbiontica]
MVDLPAYPEEVLPSPAAPAVASGEGAADDMSLLTERKSSVTIPITPLPITLQGSENIQEHAEEMTEPQPEAEADESAFATAESNGNGEEAEGSAACASFDAGETEVQEDADCEEDGGELLSQLSHSASGALAGPGRQCVEVAHEGGAEDGATAAAQGGPGPQPSAGGSDGDQRAEAGQEDSGSETYTSDGDDDDGYITTAAAFGHRTFAESLTIHVSEMERARDAALAEAAPRVSARDIGTTLAAQAVGPLDLKVHVSELERARDEALAEAAPRVSARSRVEDGLERVDLPALDALPIHRSQLEKEQAAAKALGLPPRGGAGPARGGAAAAAAEAGQPGLDSLVKHRSRLERERDAALALGAPRASPRPAQAGAAAEGRGMPALGSFPVHKSRLEREKEAAATEREAGGIRKASPRKTPLQREREAAAKLAAKAAARAAKA